jgi:hypothetical protein
VATHPGRATPSEATLSARRAHACPGSRVYRLTAVRPHACAGSSAGSSGPGQFEELFDAWVRKQQDRPHGVDLITRCAPEEDLRRARRRFEATLREPTQEAQDAGIVPADISVRDVRIILTMLSAALRSPESPSDRRRAIELARSMLFASGGR